jgi:hypothetical protein
MLIDVDKLLEESKPEYVSVTIDHHEALRSINPDMSEQKIYDILDTSYPTLLTEEIVKGDKHLIRSLFTQDKVLLMMSKVIEKHKLQLRYEERVYMNKILYSMIMNNTATSQYTTDLIINIGIYNNCNPALALANVVPRQVASYLCIMRYSSFKEMNNVRRANDYILKAIKPDESAEQTIVNIYDVLYPRLTYLFEGIMIDVKDRSKLTEDEREIYGIQGLAILDILEQMPITSIDKVLTTYYGDLHMIFQDCPTRFSLLSIAACDYPRITDSNRRVSARSAITP